jgi:cobalamin biosynthesis protein CobD/CbiB
VTNELEQLGFKDLITGCLVVLVVLLVVPFLVLMFKISIYLAIIIGVMLAIILGIALLGRVIRVIFLRSRRGDENGKNV